jgi:SPP1 gp7 family putative phage head morphogenesis protein
VTAALFDSVFGTFRYSNGEDLMPISDIVKGMGKIELDTLEKLNNLTKLAVRKLAKESQGKSLTEIATLNWNLAPDIADQINITWDKAYKTGSKHAIEEMKAAVPVKQNSVQYAKVTDLIKALFELKPFSVFDRPKKVITKILNRNLAIAGDYAKEILAKVKRNISQGMIVQPSTMQPMPPKQVNALIQQTLSVSQARAAAIARTETTNAYNAARVETFKQSSLATHCRFLAIADDRVTDICLTRNGIVFPIEEVGKYQSPLHVNCFPQGTKILMGDGTERNIETIKIGESVKVATTSAMQKVYNVIISRFTGNLREIVLEDGKKIVCTPDHPIWDGQAFTAAAKIRVGQELWIDGSLGQGTQGDSRVLLCDSGNAYASVSGQARSNTESNKGDHRIRSNQDRENFSSIHGGELDILRAEWQQDYRNVFDGQDGVGADCQNLGLSKATSPRLVENFRGSDEGRIGVDRVSMGTRPTEQEGKSGCSHDECTGESRPIKQRQKKSRNISKDEKAQSNAHGRNSRESFGYQNSEWQCAERDTQPILREESQAKSRAFLQSGDKAGFTDGLLSLIMGSQFCKDIKPSETRMAARTHGFSTANRDYLLPRLLSTETKPLHRDQRQMASGWFGKISAFQRNLPRDQDSANKRGEVQISCTAFQNITPLRVTEIKDIPFDGIVYNLSVENDEIYFANGVLVHNCRSTISVLMPKINPQHAKMIVDPNLDPNNRVLAPLPPNWR